MRRGRDLTANLAARMLFYAASASGLAAAPVAQAQTPTDAAPAETSPGVIGYPPAFFDDARPSHALDMVRRLPGFAYDPGNTGVRGFSGAAGNVLIDGQRPSAKSTSLDDILNRIPPLDVARIDVIRTAAAGVDMQGRAVVANVVRRTGASTARAVQFAAKATGQLAGAEGRLEWSHRDGPVSLGAAVWFEREEDGWAGQGRRLRLSPTGTLRQSADYLADYREHDVGGSASAERRGEVDVLRLNLGAGYSRDERLDRFHVDRGAGAPFSEQTDTETVETRGEIGMDYERRFGERLTARLLGLQRVTRNEETAAFVEPGAAEGAEEAVTTGETILRAAATFRPSERLSLDGGLEGAFNSMEAASERVADGAPVEAPNADVRVEEQRGEAFLLANLAVSPSVSLQLGARHEASVISQSGDTAQEKSFSFFKPRALATLSRGLAQARLRLEREVGQLNFRDFAASSELESGTVTAGNADLEPERWWVAEFALEQRFWDRGAVAASFRREWVEAAVDRVPIVTPSGAFEAPGNVGDAVRDIAKLNVALPLDWAGVAGGLLKLDGTWRWSAIDDPLTGDTRRMSWQRPFEANVSLSKDMPALNSTLMLTGHVGWRETAYRLREIRVNEEDPWLTVYWDWKMRPDLTLRAEVENLLGRERRRERIVFDGVRAESAALERELLDARRDRTFMLRVRKTL